MAFKQSIIEKIREEHRTAPWGAKGAVVKRYAELLSCSEKKIWGVINSGRKRKKEPEKTKPLKDLTETVYKLKHKGPDGLLPASTDQALEIARKNNQIPEGV